MDRKEFNFILQKGEDFKTEFRENISGMDKDIVAFANAEGGKLLIGIGDDLSIKGFTLSNNAKSEIQSIARNCDPPIKIIISSFENIIIIDVPESMIKPHKCKDGFYLRHGATSQKLNVDEIRELFSKQGKLLYEEITNPLFTFDEMDDSKLDDFLNIAKISKVLPEKALLKNIGVLTDDDEFKNAGILFFAKDASKFLPHAIITCILYKGTTKAHIIDRKDFGKDILSNYENTIVFIHQHLKVGYKFVGFGPRKEIMEIPERALKEALINAICHRDYSERGAVIMIDIYDDRVEISNPGGLIIKERDFGKKSLSRNPLIFSLMQMIGLVEKAGSGIARMRGEMAESGLSEPIFEFTTFFTVTFRRQSVEEFGRKVGERLGDKLGEKLGENELKILELISNNNHISAKELSQNIGISETAVENNIAKLKKKALLRRVGPDKGGRWEIMG